MKQKQPGIQDEVNRIIADHTSGSSTVLRQLCILLEKHLEDSKSEEGVIEAFLKYSKPLESLFAIVYHFNSFLRNELKLGERLIWIRIKKYLDFWEEQEKSVIVKAIEYLNLGNHRVLLHSNSGTIIRLFQALSDQNTAMRVLQTESRPLNEGIIQATILAKQGHEVTLITDSSVHNHNKEFDCCLLGADAIYKNQFINKIGSYNHALLCHHFNKPVYVLADKRKKVNINWHFNQRPKPPDEIMKNADMRILINNYYFETIPNKLINKFILD